MPKIFSANCFAKRIKPAAVRVSRAGEYIPGQNVPARQFLSQAGQPGFFRFNATGQFKHQDLHGLAQGVFAGLFDVVVERQASPITAGILPSLDEPPIKAVRLGASQVARDVVFQEMKDHWQGH